MSVFNEKIIERDKMTNNFVKAEDLIHGTWMIESVDIIQSNNPKYGAREKGNDGKPDKLFEQGILQEGETLRYSLINDAGEAKVYDSKGVALYIAVKKANVDKGEPIRFTKTGSGDNTRYTVERVQV